MIPGMREHLLGYLLGALDVAEQEAVEQALENDISLRSELDCLAANLEPLRADRQNEDPPVGLASRTCRMVMEFVESEESSGESTEPAAPELVAPAQRREPVTQGVKKKEERRKERKA